MSKNTFDQPLPFSGLLEASRKTLLQAYDLRRVNEGKDIEWDGPLPTHNLAQGIPIPDMLKASFLKKQLEDQGYDALDIVIEVILNLGIAQGIAIEKEKTSSVKELITLYAERLVKYANQM